MDGSAAAGAVVAVVADNADLYERVAEVVLAAWMIYRMLRAKLKILHRFRFPLTSFSIDHLFPLS